MGRAHEEESRGQGGRLVCQGRQVGRGRSWEWPELICQDKWELLPAFLKVKGLVKQHLDSFNYFVQTDIKKILEANSLVVSDTDPKFFIKYTNIRIGPPTRRDNTHSDKAVTPMECRLTDSTYAGGIYVDITYSLEGAPKAAKGIHIGSLPIMLRSNLCNLRGKNEAQFAKMGECPMDPGGYFVVRGQEKVILVQEQLSKNRIIVMADTKKDVVTAEVTS
jgi:DNA-directed RNA polymerase III subunit RPC2